MQTESLKKLIGKECLAIDPRSRKKEYEAATVIASYWKAQEIGTSHIIERITFTVRLDRFTTPARKMFSPYQRVFDVGGDRIRFGLEVSNEFLENGFIID